MPSYLSEEIFGELFRNAPDHLVGDAYFQNVADTVYAWADEFENWIDPDSEYYAETLWEAGQRGVNETKDAVLEFLAEARYRRDLFGEAFDLDAFVKRVESFEAQPDLEGV